jgi:hypothetical protein
MWKSTAYISSCDSTNINQHLQHFPNIYWIKVYEITALWRHLHPHVHGSISHNFQNMKTNVCWQMDKAIVLHTHARTCMGILLSFNNRKRSSICYNIGKHGGHYANEIRDIKSNTASSHLYYVEIRKKRLST